MAEVYHKKPMMSTKKNRFWNFFQHCTSAPNEISPIFSRLLPANGQMGYNPAHDESDSIYFRAFPLDDGGQRKGEEIIREVRDALRCSETEEDMIPNFAERMRAARSKDEMDNTLMEQVCRMVQSARKEMAEEKNASGSRDG